MKKIVLIPLIVGGILAVGGGVLVGCSLGDINAETNTHDLTGKTFSKFDFNLDTSDVEFISSTESKVVCIESKRIKHDVKVENDTLSIKIEGKKKWFQLFEPSKKVQIYIPASTYSTLNIKLSTGDISVPSGFSFSETKMELSTGKIQFKGDVETKLNFVQSTGDVKLENVHAGEIYLESSTGKKEISNVTVTGDVTLKSSTGDTIITKLNCKNLTLTASTGEVKASEAVMDGDLSVKVSTGDIKFANSDAQKINIQTSTGDVELSLLSSHDVEVETDTGDTDYPKHAEGPACDITTDTGDVKVSFVS